MSPEELFKIEDTEIPEITEDNISSSGGDVTEEIKIDIFDKDLTIEDLMEFLKKNNMPTDSEIVEKYYKEIVTNNKEKETIAEIIKELDFEKETIIKQTEVEPNNPILLKKINDLEEKISDLNTEERIKEDNVKVIIREISKVDVEEPELESTQEVVVQRPQNVEVENINAEETGSNLESEINAEETGANLESEINAEEMGANLESEIIPENVQNNEEVQMLPEEINQTSNIKIENEETAKTNPLEEMNTASSEEDKEFFKTIEDNETLKEVKKNNDMLKEMSKNIEYNLELVLKAISENNKESNVEKNPEIGEVDPAYVENPKISQPQYIDEYRKSLRKYGGLESFMGYDVPFKGDNLGSYV
jgi:hypothetical protein